ncbi:hypothetical protein HG531_001202 [Fusarium graminearum]|nr:hypothetical protein HG531_001202 [Fusarium graminearum]
MVSPVYFARQVFLLTVGSEFLDTLPYEDASPQRVIINVNLGTETIVELDQVSNRASISVAIPFVVDVVDSFLIYKIVALDLIRKVGVQLLVDIENLVVALKLLNSGILNRRLNLDWVVLGQLLPVLLIDDHVVHADSWDLQQIATARRPDQANTYIQRKPDPSDGYRRESLVIRKLSWIEELGQNRASSLSPSDFIIEPAIDSGRPSLQLFALEIL